MYRFIGHDNWSRRFPTDFSNDLMTGNLYNKMINVTVLRASLFFHSGEKTTLDRIKANFTDEAIAKLVHDKFIEIHN